MIQEAISWTGAALCFGALGYIFVGRTYVTPPPSTRVSLRGLIAAEKQQHAGEGSASKMA